MNDIILLMIDESCVFDEPEGKSLNIMHTRSVNLESGLKTLHIYYGLRRVRTILCALCANLSKDKPYDTFYNYIIIIVILNFV